MKMPPAIYALKLLIHYYVIRAREGLSVSLFLLSLLIYKLQTIYILWSGTIQKGQKTIMATTTRRRQLQGREVVGVSPSLIVDNSFLTNHPACDQCRKTKSKCERPKGESKTCKSCALTGTGEHLCVCTQGRYFIPLSSKDAHFWVGDNCENLSAALLI